MPVCAEESDGMEKRDNYKIQAAQARERFLTYDQQALIRKFRMKD